MFRLSLLSKSVVSQLYANNVIVDHQWFYILDTIVRSGYNHL